MSHLDKEKRKLVVRIERIRGQVDAMLHGNFDAPALKPLASKLAVFVADLIQLEQQWACSRR
jgi:hypothetical protein